MNISLWETDSTVGKKTMGCVRAVLDQLGLTVITQSSFFFSNLIFK